MPSRVITLVQASTANRIILVIDQFEEAFTLCTDLKEREAFFQCLLEALEQTNNKLCLILAMRIDFFGKCVEHKYSGLSQIIQANLITIPPMKTEELRQAIASPAEKVKLSLESGLAETILKDVEGSPGSLPLLQDTLTELWKRRKDNQLKFTAYSKLGGIGGTLNQRATEVYKGLSELEKDAAQHIFLALTTLGEGTEDTRRRVLKQDLVTSKHNQELIDNVVQKLADEKLIVTRNQVESNSQIGQQAEIDVAHEALIRNWTLLRQWLDECRDKLRQKRKIEDAAKDWEKSGQKTDYLLSKKRLKEAQDFQKEQQEKYPLSELASSFVAKSSKHQRRETIKSLGFFLIIPLIGTVIGGYFVVRELLLNADNKLILDCTGKEHCSGRIKALERLVKAKRSVESYNLSSAILNGADLNGAILKSAILKSANLKSAILNGAILIGADLDSAILIGADLNGANLIDANLDSADLIDANLYSAILSFANLNDAILSFANLNGAILIGAILIDANLYSTNLNGANLIDANLYSTNLNDANLIEAKNFTPSQIKSACYWDKAIYKGNWDKEKQEWIVDEKANKKYIEQLKQDKASDPKKPVDCSIWK